MDAASEIRSRLAIEDVVSEYVQLKRAGRNWRGLSPFTNEKTPSFMVSPEKQIWHDFSSGKGGNIFTFIMEVEGLDFKQALELLARKAGVDLDDYRTSPSRRGPNKERLYQLLELAAKFYQVQLSKNNKVLDYVIKQRQFSKDTVLEWRLGYSPNNGKALIDFAKNKGFTDEELKRTGLSANAYRGGLQDMFRARLMIPLQDQQGRVIGFTARLLDDIPNAPKYINTPQTPLYDKSQHVYGLHLAKESIRKSKFVVLTEGNLDVIASHQAGVRQTVATAGTALTEKQLKILGRFTGDIRLAFDADKAGVNATERAIPIASKAKVSLSVIEIPAGKDPDELIKKDPKEWQKAVENHEYAIDWLMQKYAKELNLSSATGKKTFSDVLLPLIRQLADEVERDHYLSLIAEKLDVSRDALDAKYSKSKAQNTIMKRVKTAPVTDRKLIENKKVQDHYLSLMLMRMTLREFLNLIKLDMLFEEQARELLNFLKNNPEFDGKNAIPSKNLTDYVKILSLLYEELYQGLELNELYYEAARLQAKLVEIYVRNQKAKIAAELNSADTKKTKELLEQARQFDILLNQVKGAS